MQENSSLVPANGIELCYDTFGERTAPPLLLIMGLAAQMIAWDEAFCEQLAARGYFVIRFDNRDIGRSTRFPQHGTPDLMALLGQALMGKPIAAPYTLRDMAADSAGLLDALGIERAHVVGASMGGAIGQEMVTHFADKVRTLTSIMSSTGSPSLPQATPKAMAVLLAPPPKDRTAISRATSAPGPCCAAQAFRWMKLGTWSVPHVPGTAVSIPQVWHGSWRPSSRRATAPRHSATCACPPS